MRKSEFLLSCSKTGWRYHIWAFLFRRIRDGVKTNLAAPVIHVEDVPSLVEFDRRYEKWMSAKADEIFQLAKEEWPIAVAAATPDCNEYMERELRVCVMLRAALMNKFGTTGR